MPRTITTPVIYIPDHDTELLKYAHQWNKGRAAKGKGFYIIRHHKGKKFKVLEDVQTTTKVYVLAHGVQTQPFLSTCTAYYSPQKLAERLRDEGLSPNHRDLRVFACNTGLAIRKDQPNLSKKEKAEAHQLQPWELDAWVEKKGIKLPEDYTGADQQFKPFAMQLAAVLRGPKFGFIFIQVTGYKGFTAPAYGGPSNDVAMSAQDTYKGVYVPGDKTYSRHRAKDMRATY
jgi:hypothetical protein